MPKQRDSRKCRRDSLAVIETGMTLKIQFVVGTNNGRGGQTQEFTKMNVVMHKVDNEHSDRIAFGDVVYITHAITGRVIYGSSFSKSTKWKWHDEELLDNEKCHFTIKGGKPGKFLSVNACFQLESVHWKEYSLSSRQRTSTEWAAIAEHKLRIVPRSKLASRDDLASHVRVIKVFEGSKRESGQDKREETASSSFCMSDAETSMAIDSLLF